MKENRKQLAERLLSALQQGAEGNAEGNNCDAGAVLTSLEGESLQLNQLPIKVISLLGGLLSAMLFTGFLLVLGLWQSGAAMSFFGLMFMGSALLVVNKEVNTYLSATVIAFLFIGLCLFGGGVGVGSESISLVCLSLMLVSGILLFLSRQGLVLFLLTLVFLGSLLFLFLETEVYGLLHVLVALMALLLLGWTAAEIRLITTSARLNEAYRPIRMGIFFAFGILMVFMAIPGEFGSKIPHLWISGLLLLLALFVFAWNMLQRLGAQEPQQSQWRYLMLPLLMLPLIPAPGVTGGFLLVLLAFHLRHLPSLICGVAAFCTALFLFYYDLQLTLLQKSGMLLLSGGGRLR